MPSLIYDNCSGGNYQSYICNCWHCCPGNTLWHTFFVFWIDKETRTNTKLTTTTLVYNGKIVLLLILHNWWAFITGSIQFGYDIYLSRVFVSDGRNPRTLLFLNVLMVILDILSVTGDGASISIYSIILDYISNVWTAPGCVPICDPFRRVCIIIRR